jgi:hypothetical protein
MAYNPKNKSRPEIDADENVANSTAMVRFLKPNPIRKDGKREYYMEWWRLGDPETAIDLGTFHCANIKTFVKMFMGLKKFTVIFLRREHDQRILWDRRSGSRQV